MTGTVESLNGCGEIGSDETRARFGIVIEHRPVEVERDDVPVGSANALHGYARAAGPEVIGSKTSSPPR